MLRRHICVTRSPAVILSFTGNKDKGVQLVLLYIVLIICLLIG